MPPMRVAYCGQSGEDARTAAPGGSFCTSAPCHCGARLPPTGRPAMIRILARLRVGQLDIENADFRRRFVLPTLPPSDAASN